ncbi:MAG: hypothetical protein ACYC5V_02300 [Gemmatimonadaceae bacterium]
MANGRRMRRSSGWLSVARRFGMMVAQMPLADREALMRSRAASERVTFRLARDIVRVSRTQAEFEARLDAVVGLRTSARYGPPARVPTVVRYDRLAVWADPVGEVHAMIAALREEGRRYASRLRAEFGAIAAAEAIALHAAGGEVPSLAAAIVAMLRRAGSADSTVPAERALRCLEELDVALGTVLARAAQAAHQVRPLRVPIGGARDGTAHEGSGRDGGAGDGSAGDGDVVA